MEDIVIMQAMEMEASEDSVIMQAMETEASEEALEVLAILQASIHMAMMSIRII